MADQGYGLNSSQPKNSIHKSIDLSISQHCCLQLLMIWQQHMVMTPLHWTQCVLQTPKQTTPMCTHITANPLHHPIATAHTHMTSPLKKKTHPSNDEDPCALYVCVCVCASVCLQCMCVHCMCVYVCIVFVYVCGCVTHFLWALLCPASKNKQISLSHTLPYCLVTQPAYTPKNASSLSHILPLLPCMCFDRSAPLSTL